MKYLRMLCLPGHPGLGCCRLCAGGNQACRSCFVARSIAGGIDAIICTTSPANARAPDDHRCDCRPPGKPV